MSDDEAPPKRYLILHFDLNKTILPHDPYDQLDSIEIFVSDMISTRAWGEVTFNDEGQEDAEAQEPQEPQELTPEQEAQKYQNSTWTLKSKELTLDGPEGLMSSKQYLDKKFPRAHASSDEEMEKQVNPISKLEFFENEGAFFKPVYEKLLKSIKLPANSVNTADIDENVMQCYDNKRYHIIPAFFKTMLYLKKRKRDFSIVFRTHGRELGRVIEEFNNFCEGKHPAFNGEAGTHLVKFDGSKPGSKDYRIQGRQTGMFFRFSPHITDIRFLMNTLEREKCENHDQLIEHYGGQIEEGTINLFEDSIEEQYAVMIDTLRRLNAMAIQDDFWAYWNNQKSNDLGKVLLIDQNDFSVQNIFFDDLAVPGPNSNVDVRDLATGEKIPEKKYRDKYVVRADIFQAFQEHDYFIKKIDECEKKRDEEIERLQMGINSSDEEEEVESEKGLEDLPNEEYLLKTVTPLLYQGLNFIATERPQNPIEFLALYMLQNQHLVKIPKPKQKEA